MRILDGAWAGTLVLACLAFVAVEGCGGEEDGSDRSAPPTVAPLTRAAYVDEANAICQRIGDDTTGYVDEAYGALGDSETLSEAADDELLQRIVERQRAGLDELRALPAPEGDEAEVERLLAALERAINQLSRIERDQPGGEAPALDEFNALARAYGLDGCTEPAPE